MNKIAVVAASAAAVALGAAVWVSQQIADAPTSGTSSGQVDTTSGQDMRPRWVDNGGQGDGASN